MDQRAVRLSGWCEGMAYESTESVKWHSPVFIITGEQGEGKTTFLMEVLPKLAEEGVRIRGILAPGYFQDGHRTGFSLIDLATGAYEELCSERSSSCGEKHGRFYFRSEGLTFGYRALRSPLISDKTDLFVIDEVGMFELNGEVWACCINNLVGKPYPPMIWTVRHSLVNAVAERWPVTRTVVVQVSAARHATFIGDLMEEIRMYRSGV